MSAVSPSTRTSFRPIVIGCLLLCAFAVLGCWALVVRFREGLVVTNLTQHVPWGFWIALYIYFIGLSAGSFLLSTLSYVFGVKRLETVAPTALVQALGCMLLAFFLIFIDLGHPERFLNVLFYWNPRSILAWECLFYLAYVAIILAELFLVLRPALARRAYAGGRFAGLSAALALGRRIPDAAWRAGAARWVKILAMIGIPVAIGVHGGTGAIFAVAKARPNWFSGLFPVIFLVSALASGSGLLTFLAAFVTRVPEREKHLLVRHLAEITLGFAVMDALLLACEILVAQYGGIPQDTVGWQTTLFGPFWWVFWFVQMGCSVVIPVVLVLLPVTRRSTGWLGAAGGLVALGVLGTRLNIVIPPLIHPTFDTLPAAYQHSRFAWGYFPSTNEWLVGVGTVAMGVAAYLVVRHLLPLEESATDET
jgi:molybdopterin-containing oxidoreductase family membrane subunit